MDVVNHFAYEHHYLSNFYACTIVYGGIVYASTEHAYQAAKTLDPQRRKMLGLEMNPRLTAASAKHIGRNLNIRPDWEEVKIQIMRELLWLKFDNPTLKQKLIATGDAYLEEGNWWHDTFWGVCHGKLDGRTCKKIRLHQAADERGEIADELLHIGENRLGLLLMEVRALAHGSPSVQDTEARACGCTVMKGWRCPVHDAP